MSSESTKSSLGGQTALVTGGSRGIGLAMARKFLQLGARVVITGRKEEGLQSALRDLHDAGLNDVRAVAAHSAKPEAVSAAFDTAESEFGVVQIVVNNAATNPVITPLVETDLSAVSKILETNVHGYLIVAQEAAKRLRSANQPGSIINVSSVAGDRSWGGLGAYGVSKAAVNMMTRVLADELGPDRIRVNGIAPGLVRTRFSAALWKTPEQEAAYNRQVPLGRIAEVDDIVGAAVYLASDASRYVTGQTMVVDGGMTVH